MEFTPPIKEFSVTSSDEGLQSCALLVVDALGRQFSLQVQTQGRFTESVLDEPGAEIQGQEPVFMIEQPHLDEDTLHRIIAGVDPVLLGRFLVQQAEAG